MREWNFSDIKDEPPLYLLTPEEFEQLPDGIELICISGETVIKGKDHIDDDTRAGRLAYGIVDPFNHPLKDLFLTFLLRS
jgi:Uma2 family endonuclease